MHILLICCFLIIFLLICCLCILVSLFVCCSNAQLSDSQRLTTHDCVYRTSRLIKRLDDRKTNPKFDGAAIKILVSSQIAQKRDLRPVWASESLLAAVWASESFAVVLRSNKASRVLVQGKPSSGCGPLAPSGLAIYVLARDCLRHESNGFSH